jgi:hypothetical protein
LNVVIKWLKKLKFDRNLIAYLSTSAERNDVEVGENFEEQLLRQLSVDRSLLIVAEDSTQFPVGTRSAGRSRSGGLTSGLDRSRSWILRLLMMASVIVTILEKKFIRVWTEIIFGKVFKTLNEMKQIRIIGFQIFNDFKDLLAILKYNYFRPFVSQFYTF